MYKMRNIRQFDGKVLPEFSDAEIGICITFPDKPGEGSTQVISFKFWPLIDVVIPI
jgi:hypothetical protein